MEKVRVDMRSCNWALETYMLTNAVARAIKEATRSATTTCTT
jgi:hypothetical protein